MNPYFKITIWLFAAYLLAFILLWQGSRHPQLKDVPVLFAAGMVSALLALFDMKSKTINTVVLAAAIILLLANLVNFWAAFRLVKGIFG
ncbi:hypothetical protein [Deminuibacter soli]|uniref:Uncharacterized protein n=1 Tax=Deminuibacter soli TaxID=2291815 RepID=A0A3E1NP96_9BACT|nr:hypothetical protein [Deminuibacter soli]RFM29759.1 hypothetical protein DXN05_01920 [Deminuibacter soli]